jgi:hypothetical protein
MISSSSSSHNPTYVLKPEDYYRNFKQSIKSRHTFVTYDHKLKDYMKYKRIPQGEHSKLIIEEEEEEVPEIISNLDSMTTTTV